MVIFWRLVEAPVNDLSSSQMRKPTKVRICTCKECVTAYISAMEYRMNFKLETL